MMTIGDLVSYNHWRNHGNWDNKPKMGIVIEQVRSKPIENTTCFDGPTGESRTRVAWCDGSGLAWVNANHLRKEKK